MALIHNQPCKIETPGGARGKAVHWPYGWSSSFSDSFSARVHTFLPWVSFCLLFLFRFSLSVLVLLWPFFCTSLSFRPTYGDDVILLTFRRKHFHRVLALTAGWLEMEVHWSGERRVRRTSRRAVKGWRARRRPYLQKMQASEASRCWDANNFSCRLLELCVGGIIWQITISWIIGF